MVATGAAVDTVGIADRTGYEAAPEDEAPWHDAAEAAAATDASAHTRRADTVRGVTS
jgi:hypothetical protein